MESVYVICGYGITLESLAIVSMWCHMMATLLFLAWYFTQPTKQ